MTRVSQVALGADLMQRARELGFCDVGFCSVLPFEDWKRVAYEPVRSNFGHDPAELLPGAQAIVVAVRQYTAFGPWPEGSAALANYYVKSNVGFVETKELAAVLEQAGYSALANAKLPAKQAALRAGLGFQGKNTQFCHDEYGMLVSLHLILTDAPLAGEDRARRECPNCGMCAAA